jgi:hypothetical protein
MSLRVSVNIYYFWDAHFFDRRWTGFEGLMTIFFTCPSGRQCGPGFLDDLVKAVTNVSANREDNEYGFHLTANRVRILSRGKIGIQKNLVFKAKSPQLLLRNRPISYFRGLMWITQSGCRVMFGIHHFSVLTHLDPVSQPINTPTRYQSFCIILFHIRPFPKNGKWIILIHHSPVFYFL